MTELKLIKLLDGVDHLNAVDVLRDYAKLLAPHALSVVSGVATGAGTTIPVPRNISTGAVRHIRRYFELIVQHSGKANIKKPEVTVEKEITQLKLWGVSFIRNNPRSAGTGMVLAATKERAEFVIIANVQTFGQVTAVEISGRRREAIEILGN